MATDVAGAAVPHVLVRQCRATSHGASLGHMCDGAKLSFPFARLLGWMRNCNDYLFAESMHLAIASGLLQIQSSAEKKWSRVVTNRFLFIFLKIIFFLFEEGVLPSA